MTSWLPWRHVVLGFSGGKRGMSIGCCALYVLQSDSPRVGSGFLGPATQALVHGMLMTRRHRTARITFRGRGEGSDDVVGPCKEQ